MDLLHNDLEKDHGLRRIVLLDRKYIDLNCGRSDFGNIFSKSPGFRFDVLIITFYVCLPFHLQQGD